MSSGVTPALDWMNESLAGLMDLLDGRRTDLPAAPSGSPLEKLGADFALSSFEHGVVLLGAARELVPGFARHCARINNANVSGSGAESHGSKGSGKGSENNGSAVNGPGYDGVATSTFPTFGMALASLPGPNWDALLPAGPLRRCHLIQLGQGDVLLERPVTLDERILHNLLGSDYLDERVSRRTTWVDAPSALPTSHELVATGIAANYGTDRLHLWTDGIDSGAPVIAAAMKQRGLSLLRFAPRSLPSDPAELDQLVQVTEREATLGRLAVMIDLDDATDPTQSAVALTAANALGPLAVTCGVDPRAGDSVLRSRLQPAGFSDRQDHWRSALAGIIEIDDLDQLVARFILDSKALDAVCGELQQQLATQPDADPRALLWQGARVQAHAKLEDLAQRLTSSRQWSDLVLPETTMHGLRAVLGHARQKATVDHRWGFTAEGDRGGGSAALFAGPSGTGKTLAAEVLATELELDLYRVDLSAVVSKFIGETEKNLRRVFDAAEAGGAILLFDEADALFGKRTEVKDSHDRHANIEVSYLLSRMESFAGLALLTTNHRKHLDEAFLRRIPFLIEFPFPDGKARRGIWQQAFPAETPTDGLDADRLAQLSVTGGSIRSIARNAASLAAEMDTPVTMPLIRVAVSLEYAKLGRPLNPSELVGWP